MNRSFPWQTGKTFSEIIRYTLKDAVQDYLKSKQADGIREGTVKIYQLGLTHFQTAVGKTLPVREITINHIDQYKAYFLDKIKPATVNMDLRTIRAFLHWLEERGKIDAIPRIKIRKENRLPVYLTNTEFDEILNRIDPHFQRAFWFYRETGLRLSEPFNGEINGSFLTIPADQYKGKKDHTVYLTPELKAIALEMKSMVEEKVKRGISTRINAIQLYTAVFYKACQGNKKKGLEPIRHRKFHSLRHTSAVRLYLKTRDIYAVMKRCHEAARA
ncbi:MAG: tyrosine-type recombinase/integrase [FCB group bacterium]|nr:tyrosine-type recombinase/integrase [FCB group bacterium]